MTRLQFEAENESWSFVIASRVAIYLALILLNNFLADANAHTYAFCMIIFRSLL